jgi:hypothetical protein
MAFWDRGRARHLLTNVPVHRHFRILLTAFALTTAATPVGAQKAPGHDHGLLLLPNAQYGTPLKTSVGLGLFFETSDDGQLLSGAIVEGAAGQGGIRGAFGLQRFLEYIGLDVRAVVHRTWSSPRGASADSTYLGGEMGLTIAYVRLSLGFARRVAGPSGEKATIKTWTAGMQIPIWR